ncbi:MAG: transposase, partial [Pseudomonadota bacterium]
MKQIRSESVNVNSDENKNKRQAFATRYMAKLDDGFVPVFQDETNFNVFCKRSNGRSKTGTRVHIKQPSSKGPNLHCIGAITQHSLVMFETRRGSLKADNFYHYLSTIVDNCLGRGIRKLLVVIDNAPAHSRAEDQLRQKVQTLDASAFDAVELLRLSPYSPSLNPIENFWSKFKTEVKSEMRRRRSEITHNDVGREPGESIVSKRLRIMEDIARQSADRTAAVRDIGQDLKNMHN